MKDKERVSVLREWAAEADSVVFFGGAGVSTASGIPDFRSADGLYNLKYRFPPEQMLSIDFFNACPSEFYRFYFDKMIYPEARPNAAHIALAEAEARGKVKAVVTQNIDGLHQAAGSRNVLELHGSVHRNRCPHCGRSYSLEQMFSLRDASADGIPRCGCGHTVKPSVVLYGEPLPEAATEAAIAAIAACDLLIIGGTSLTVYPAAGFVNFAKGRIALVNKSRTDYDDAADLAICDSVEILAGVL